MANKILLADDSITIQKVVNLTFTDEGINVVTVGNGELALKKLGDEHFDLVLADIFMPGRNGYEVCEFVKRNPAMEGVPVILLVGAFEPFDKAEAARVQADGHLTKPFESRILIETVKRMLAEAAVLKAQSAAPAQDPGSYRGQVVGWDVPTSPMMPVTPQQLEEQEPEPPPYDPYASTAKLRPLPDTPPAEAPAERDDNRTLGLGAPLPTGALFSHPDAELLSFEPPSDGVPFELAEPMPTPEDAPARAIEGPPDSVAGFSFNTGSGPLPDTEAPVEDRPSIGYQHIQPTDSPLDLPDMGVIEQHAHEPAQIEEVRDPLLETFADVSDATSSVESAAAPGLEVNMHEDAPPSMHVGATEGLVSAWDTSAQPEAPPAPEPEPVPEREGADAAVWHTQAFTATTPPPFGFSEEPEPPAAEEPPHSTPTLGLTDLSDLETIRSSSATERFAMEEFTAITSPAEPSPEEAPTVWEPEVEDEAPPPAVEEPAADVHVAAAPEATEVEASPEAAAPEAAEDAAPEAVEASAAPAAPAAPVNGSGDAHFAIPQEIFDEVVRRTVERMNDDVIREIAWDVVPELAEQLIRKRLSENR